MLAKRQMNSSRLPSVIVLLLVLALFTMALATGFSLSAREDDPNHVITYTENKLEWDSATELRDDGTAKLDFFSAVYDSVQSRNGKKLVAPGCEGHNYIQFKNDAENPVDFVVLVYQLKTDDALPVYATLEDGDFTNAEYYNLPEGVEDKDVIRVVEGTVDGNGQVDFDLSWNWSFEDADRDALDTDLGSKAAVSPDKYTVGFQIVVEDNNNYVDSADNMLYNKLGPNGIFWSMSIIDVALLGVAAWRIIHYIRMGNVIPFFRKKRKD